MKVLFKPRIREHIWKWNTKPEHTGLSRVGGVFMGLLRVVWLLFITIQQIPKCRFAIVLDFAAVLLIQDLNNVLVSQVKRVQFMYKPLNVILTKFIVTAIFSVYVFIASESNTMSDTFKSMSIIQFSHFQPYLWLTE